MSLKVSALYCFPVKSMGGMPIQQASIDRFGIQHDRRWMLVDQNGKFITQRQCVNMVRLSALYEDKNLTLSYRPEEGDIETLNIAENDFKVSNNLHVSVWRDQCEALIANDHISEWLSERLRRACRLVFMPDTTKRLVDPVFASSNETVSFADGFPLLLTTDASLNDFNQHLSRPIEMLRFRPNVVISGNDPWAEDQWQSIKIGELIFDLVKPCSRCVMPTINRSTAKKEPEVFKMLTKHRAKDGEVFFGQNLLVRGQGSISVGDKVELLS